MRKIAIQDASILIDLINIGLFSHCLQLEFYFFTPQLIFEIELNEKQVATIQLHIDSGRFNILKTSEEDLLEILLAVPEDNRLSVQDWSVIYYSEKLHALLLSGDKILRKVAETKGIEVRGILWVFDQLEQFGLISKKEACNFLKELMKQNKRLPAEECRKRIELWCGI